MAYDTLIQCYYATANRFDLLRFLVIGSRVLEHSQIPIIINNRNRLTFLRTQIESLRSRGYSNITVLDNDSTYPPLLEFYKSAPCRVIFLGKNLGFDALAKIDLYRIVRRNFYVYTDPDVVPIDECPGNFLEVFRDILLRHKEIQKVGFSLKIDDLPDHYQAKDDVIAWERKYFNNPVDDILFLAPIDTTFALHRPYARIGTRGGLRMYRTGYPYTARHLPWYVDSTNLQEEERFYIETVEIGTHWTKGIRLEDGYVKSLIRRLMRWK